MALNELLAYFDRTTDPRRNLAREDEIFSLVDKGALPQVARFWISSECLVRGRARSAKYGWYNEELAERLGIPVLERSTGGGVVYHDMGNLNWSFFLKTSGRLLSPSSVFELGSRHVVEALKGMHLPACFSPPNRIDVSGRKVGGMAARSTVRTLLVHGTLLIHSDLQKLNMLCVPPADCPPVSNLSEWKDGLDAQRVVTALFDALRRAGFAPNAIESTE